MFLLYWMSILCMFALFETIFPEAYNKLCHVLYRFFMGGEDYD